ncbi:30S ribosomal protein S9 [Candidatus Gottesmanbacteria bacterium]|nr:30S ribosomal protein S9 [Candidatus Gottesmanbacteria bacterium]
MAEPKEPKEKTFSYYEAVGRRKESSARVRLYVVKEGIISVQKVEVAKGDIIINGKPIEKYFVGEVYKKIYLEPFRTTNTIGRFATSITVVGGGTVGQLGAVIHALSRALTKVDPEKFRTILRKRGFLTRDARIKERRKAGLAGKARAKKQSPKR